MADDDAYEKDDDAYDVAGFSDGSREAQLGMMVAQGIAELLVGPGSAAPVSPKPAAPGPGSAQAAPAQLPGSRRTLEV